MSQPETKNALIKSTQLGYEDHGILTYFLHLDYGGSGQGFGGRVMRGKYLALHVEKILDVVGVDSWERLPGKHIRVRATNDRVEAIGHVILDQWFEPELLDAKVSA